MGCKAAAGGHILCTYSIDGRVPVYLEQGHGAGNRALREHTAQGVTLPWLQSCCLASAGPDGSSDPTLLLTCLGLLPSVISPWPAAGHGGGNSRLRCSLSLGLWLCRQSLTGSEALVWGPTDACEEGAGPLSPYAVVRTQACLAARDAWCRGWLGSVAAAFPSRLTCRVGLAAAAQGKLQRSDARPLQEQVQAKNAL